MIDKIINILKENNFKVEKFIGRFPGEDIEFEEQGIEIKKRWIAYHNVTDNILLYI